MIRRRRGSKFDVVIGISSHHRSSQSLSLVHISEHVDCISQHVPASSNRKPNDVTPQISQMKSTEQTNNTKKWESSPPPTKDPHTKNTKLDFKSWINSSTQQLSNHPNETSIRRILIARKGNAIKSAIHYLRQRCRGQWEWSDPGWW